MRALELTGKTFGRLTVLKRAPMKPLKGVWWLCRCSCVAGTYTLVESENLSSGNTKSCGCFKRDATAKANIKHGAARYGRRTGALKSYMHAKQRCTNPRDVKYPSYGGRGIDFRFTSFEQFFAEVGHRPFRETLDRINNEGHYEPGNVKWSTRASRV